MWSDYQDALHDADATGKHLRISDQYPLTARGDINTYSVFTERFWNLVRPEGRVGAVVPTGIATDDTTKDFFAALMESRRLISLFGMDNEAMIYFPGIDHRNKFGLTTIGGNSLSTDLPVFTFTCSRIEDTRKHERRFTMSDEEMRLLSPNTRTSAVFRTRVDAELTKEIYRRVQVLIDEVHESNAWNIRFMTMFHMANDSDLFATESGPGRLMLYEAKMIHHFDHRYGTYEGATQANINEGSLPRPSEQQKEDSSFTTLSRYWIEARHVYLRCATIPEGLRKAIRTGNLELIRLELAHLFFAKWLSATGRPPGLYTNWLRFIEEFPFARPVAPTQLGLCGNNPPLLSPTSTDDLPGEPIEDIAVGPRNLTTWYSPNPELVQTYISTMSKYRFRLPSYRLSDDQISSAVDQLLRETSPKWLLAFKDIGNNNLERTATFSFLPLTAVGHTAPLVLFDDGTKTPQIICLLANLDSIVFDYVSRQKIGGTHLTYFILKQLPVLGPSSYIPEHIRFVVPRATELVSTAWDIQPFLDDLWRDADTELRALLERQSRDNREATGGHTYDPPRWYTPPEDPCPLPPFKWDEDRRASLRAELDAYCAMLYGLDERELRYILDPTDVYGQDFPGETFRVLKEKEIVSRAE